MEKFKVLTEGVTVAGQAYEVGAEFESEVTAEVQAALDAGTVEKVVAAQE